MNLKVRNSLRPTLSSSGSGGSPNRHLKMAPARKSKAFVRKSISHKRILQVALAQRISSPFVVTKDGAISFAAKLFRGRFFKLRQSTIASSSGI
jgi:hypothetical protein